MNWLMQFEPWQVVAATFFGILLLSWAFALILSHYGIPAPSLPKGTWIMAGRVPIFFPDEDQK